MKFQRTVETPLAADVLFAAHRDDLVEWGPQMAEVERIEPLTLSVDNGTSVSRNRWWGSKSALPRLLRPWVPAEALSWEDEQRWSGRTCRWRIHIPALGDGAVVQGQHTYREGGGRTFVDLEGEFRFVPENSPLHIPPFVAPVVERFVAHMMASILERSVHTLARHAIAA